MMNKKTKVKSKKSLDILTIFLTLIICFFLIAAFFDFTDKYTPKYSDYSFCYHFVNNQYGYAIDNKQVMEEDKNVSDKYDEYFAVCDYIEADFLIPVYEKLGESANIARLNESKENAKENIGELSPMLPVIDSNFSN